LELPSPTPVANGGRSVRSRRGTAVHKFFKKMSQCWRPKIFCETARNSDTERILSFDRQSVFEFVSKFLERIIVREWRNENWDDEQCHFLTRDNRSSAFKKPMLYSWFPFLYITLHRHPWFCSRNGNLSHLFSL
jgi:hypothetical protein